MRMKYLPLVELSHEFLTNGEIKVFYEQNNSTEDGFTQ